MFNIYYITMNINFCIKTPTYSFMSNYNVKSEKNMYRKFLLIILKCEYFLIKLHL